ncbi:MAG TPA: hypothetical protein VH231_13235 [Solirubrobacteraceae bacterium]|nr:hypothetical protein [Solirubrobacteraceae bacterium]
MLAVDDAPWADLPSLRFLHYLLQRLDELPVALVVAARPERERRQGRLVQRLAGSPVTTALRLDPLSPRAVSALVRLTLDERASDELCRACAEATGGNPSYVGELVAALGASGTTDPTAVASLAIDAVAAAVLARLAGLPAEAGALAAAVAVLGDEAPLGAAADLAAIDGDAAPGLADALAGVALLAPGTPLRFAHPIARRAVYDDLPPARRADLHKRAAMALVGADADPELVASHVLAAVAETERWATPALRRAAERAGQRGAHEEGARYRRAMLDSVPAADRAALLRDLALAEARSHDERAAERADAALDAAQEQPLEAAAAAIALGRTLIDHGHHTDATRIFARGLAALDGMPEAAELAMTLRASRVGAGGLAAAAVAGDERATLLARAGTGTTTRAERLGLAHAAVATGLAGEDAAETVALARAAVAGVGESGATTLSATVVLLAAIALISADALDEAERLCTLLADDARRRGSVRIFATASHALHRQGNLVGGIADAESAWTPPATAGAWPSPPCTPPWPPVRSSAATSRPPGPRSRSPAAMSAGSTSSPTTTTWRRAGACAWPRATPPPRSATSRPAACAWPRPPPRSPASCPGARARPAPPRRWATANGRARWPTRTWPRRCASAPRSRTAWRRAPRASWRAATAASRSCARPSSAGRERGAAPARAGAGQPGRRAAGRRAPGRRARAAARGARPGPTAARPRRCSSACATTSWPPAPGRAGRRCPGSTR